MIRWCVSLYAKSSAAYRQLASSGFLCLPHKSTLSAHMKFTGAGPGVNPDVIDLIIKEMGISQMTEFQKKVALIWDEMKVKAGLVMDRNSGKVVGFSSLGDFNEELLELSQLATDSPLEPKVASHIIVFMLRGIMSNHNLPFLWFPCNGFAAHQLWGPVWQATSVLEDIGLQLRAWVCDGASPNRKFFRIHQRVGGQYMGATYYTTNLCDPSRKIYFICDVPHLLKTTRNNLENSHWNQNSKLLIINGKHVKWPHILSVVEHDKSRPLTRLPRIREEHTQLSPQLRMRVRLAAQVLSTSMCNAIL